MAKEVDSIHHEANQLLASLKAHCAALRHANSGGRELREIEALIGNESDPPRR